MSPFALTAQLEPEVRLLVADRTEPMKTYCLVNIDSGILFDFDEFGRLGAIEVLMRYDLWPQGTFAVPEPESEMLLRLSDELFQEDTVCFDEDVSLVQSPDRKAFALLFDEGSENGKAFVLGPNVVCQVH